MTLKRYDLLHIEDDPASRLLIQKVLANSPFEVHQRDSGMAGMELAQQLFPSLILLDMRLPDLTGAELASKLRRIKQLSDTAIVILSAHADSYTRDLALAAGCDGFLTKPVNIETLAAELLEFVDGKKEQMDQERLQAAQINFQEELVDHLSERLADLEHHRGLLLSRTKRLRDTIRKLETLHFANQNLQKAQQPQQLKSRIARELVDRFKFNRCAYLKPDPNNEHLYVMTSSGFAPLHLENLKIPFDKKTLSGLFNKRPVIYLNQSNLRGFDGIKQILHSLKIDSFLLCAFGFASPHHSRMALNQNLSGFMDQLMPADEVTPNEREVIQHHLEAYFESEVFQFGGYFFLEFDRRSRSFARSDLWMLEMFLAGGASLYQNLLLKQQLTRLFINAKKDAITDHLTGLFNFRYFSQQLERETSRAHRHQTPLAVLMLDLDFFKVYNDTFGHQAGDEVLRQLAQLLMDNTRHSDFVARYGGEEFVIICPELNRDTGLFLADKLCRIVADAPFPHEVKLPHKKVTISIGVAAFPDDAKTHSELLERADQALYQAKENGRNQACLYTPFR